MKEQIMETEEIEGERERLREKRRGGGGGVGRGGEGGGAGGCREGRSEADYFYSVIVMETGGGTIAPPAS